MSWGCAAERSTGRIAIAAFGRYFSAPPLPASAPKETEAVATTGAAGEAKAAAHGEAQAAPGGA